jgi:hypothetical protein
MTRSAKPDQPLTGDAAWRAARQAVSDRNDQAFKRGAERRAAEDAQVMARRRDADLREREILPQQPTRPTDG